MSLIAFIPARGGSKSIPLKNIKNLCGKPLIYWTISALEDSIVDKIIVATDCQEIKDIVQAFNFSKVEVFDRKKENATDVASTESVMLEYLDCSRLLDSDVFMLVQTTSPFTETHHFNEGLELLNRYDSVLSCAIDKKFAWSEDGYALNYDIKDRPRRQDYKGTLIENGAFYISNVGNIKNTKNRISGDIGIYKMPEYSIIELDEPVDWIVAEEVMRNFILKNTMLDISNIKIVLSDVDGVLTDGGMYYGENGDELKKFSVYDGMAFRILQEKGLRVGIITTEDRELNRRRAQKLGLDFDFHGIEDKLQVIKDFCDKEGIDIKQVAYIGDDINCFELLSHVGVSACPNNAVQKIKNIPSILHLKRNGGEGVVREFLDLILRSL